MSAPAARDPATEARALQRCAELTAQSHSNFYWAFLPLPRERRQGIYCVYAFCRRIDDIVDEPEPGVEPRSELDRWRRRVDDIVAGGLPGDEDPLAVGLSLTHRRFGLRGDDLHAVIDGMEMDLDRQRYQTGAELGLYCRRVAGHVGCLCLPVFGCRGEDARPYAMALGQAFQLTNILRDVPRDAAEGRIYLPLDDLGAFGVREDDLLGGRPPTPAVRELMRFEGEKAAALFRRAESLLPTGQRRALFSASIMTAIYRRLLDEMRGRDHDVWSGRPRLPVRTKLLLALGVILRDRLFRLA